MQSINVRRNMVLISVFSILVKRAFMPVIILYYLFFGLDYIQIGVIASVLAATTFIFEVPSGVFADRYGRKSSLLLATLVGFVSMCLYLFGSSFVPFVVASALFGLALSFVSGTKNALVYDTLASVGGESRYKKESGRILFYSHIGNGLLLLIIPLMYVWNIKLPFLLGVLFYFAAFWVVLFIQEPPKKKEVSRNLRQIFSDSSREALLGKSVFILILLSSIFLTFIYVTSEYYQPMLKLVGLPVAFFGVIYFAKRLFMALGAELSHRVDKIVSPYLFLIATFIVILGSYFGLSSGVFGFVLFAVIFFSFAEGLVRIFLGDEVNKRVSSKNRATIMSLGPFLTSVFKAGLALVYGFMAELVSLQFMLFFGGVLFFLVFLILMVFARNVFD